LGAESEESEIHHFDGGRAAASLRRVTRVGFHGLHKFAYLSNVTAPAELRNAERQSQTNFYKQLEASIVLDTSLVLFLVPAFESGTGVLLCDGRTVFNFQPACVSHDSIAPSPVTSGDFCSLAAVAAYAAAIIIDVRAYISRECPI
jgi:hypothetical protein